MLRAILSVPSPNVPRNSNEFLGLSSESPCISKEFSAMFGRVFVISPTDPDQEFREFASVEYKSAMFFYLFIFSYFSVDKSLALCTKQ